MRRRSGSIRRAPRRCTAASSSTRTRAISTARSPISARPSRSTPTTPAPADSFAIGPRRTAPRATRHALPPTRPKRNAAAGETGTRVAEDDKGSTLGLVIRRIVGVVAIVIGVPMLMRYCSHDDALQRISADSSRALGDQDDAIARYNGLIASDPNRAALYAGRGDSYRQKGDLDRAFADLDKAISLDPRLWEARF